MDSYNPDAAGKGGYLAVYACGCTGGWVNALDGQAMLEILNWLDAGCTIHPLVAGAVIVRQKCETHNKGEQM